MKEADVSGVVLSYFYCLNAESVNNKTLAIPDFILSKNIDISAITETWLADHTSPAVLSELIPKGYKLFHRPRTGKREGGLAIIFRDNIAVKDNFFKEMNFYNFESLNCSIALNNKVTPSKANGLSNSSFFKDRKDYLNHLMLLKQDILLTGDTNFHLESSNSPDTKHFISMLDSHNFHQHVEYTLQLMHVAIY